ncbi:vacuolar protein sorting-associated protein [Thraustotheca clavata]|uniref:Vacuolar protein sorting-associated protein n=1 Tax=Thraustotheca clavata TaxID=74557 RepID=A0A1W0A785_9STRA|nr:vacuolar protein sorting-associated protein [Thraustotheca clavata]
MKEEDALEDIDFDELDDHLEQFQQDDFIKEALAKGVDLRQYAQQIDRELRDVEMESITQYVAKSSDIVDLYNQVQACDDILARMQEMLLGFQADLGGISDEIRHLQNESIEMNVKLKNRREAEEKLRLFLDQVYIPPTLIEGIDEGEVNDAFISYLMILNNKLSYAKQASADDSSLGVLPNATPAVKQVEADLEKLKLRACAQIREWLLGRINDLKKPKTNVQIVQQTTLLKMKYALSFLHDQATSMAVEFRETYAETMSRILFGVFKAYHTGLMKLHEEAASRTDVIAVEEASLKSLFTSRVTVNKQNNAFSLGDREQILLQATTPPIMIHVAQAENLKCPYEVIFRSLQQHLMNAATSEYLFIIDFFKAADSSDTFRVREYFLRIFARTLSLCLEQLENYLCTSYDSIGLLLMIRLTTDHKNLMSKRHVPVLDSFLDRVLLLLWPRYHAVIDLNVQSVIQAKPKKLGNVELHPHYVTRRYAELVASILTLAPEPSHDEVDGANTMILNGLASLREGLVGLLEKLSEVHKNSKDKCVFLINNYDLVTSVVTERKIASDETAKFEELLVVQRDKFVEEELMCWYGSLITFVQQTESKGIPADAAKVEKIVKEFNAHWKTGIDKMNGNIMKFFSNFRNGMEILKQVLTQLLLYYTRFIDIVKRSWARPPSFSNDIVTTQEILYEIKKYSRSF